MTRRVVQWDAPPQPWNPAPPVPPERGDTPPMHHGARVLRWLMTPEGAEGYGYLDDDSLSDALAASRWAVAPRHLSPVVLDTIGAIAHGCARVLKARAAEHAARLATLTADDPQPASGGGQRVPVPVPPTTRPPGAPAMRPQPAPAPAAPAGRDGWGF
jgi:hypothetical protein